MAAALRHLFILLRKELLYIFRVPDVLISSVLIPMVIYPSMLIGAAVYGYLISKDNERNVYKVAFVSPCRKTDWLNDAFKISKQIKIVSSSDADRDLRKGTIDLAVYGDETAADIEIRYNESELKSSSAVPFLRQHLDTYESNRLRKAMKSRGLPTRDLRAFTVRMKDVNTAGAGKSRKADFDEAIAPLLRYGILFMIFFLITNARSSAVSPAVSMLVQERDQRTLQATLALPVSRDILILAKALTVVIMALLSVLINIIALIALIVSFMLIIASRGVGPEMAAETFSTATLTVVMTIAIAALLDVLLSSCIFLLLCGYTRSTKEAQSYLIIASFAMIGISITALWPGLTLNAWTAAIPLVNLMLVIKAASKGTATALPVFIAFAESLLLIYVVVHLTSSRLRQESFILKQEARLPWRKKISGSGH
ncbi:MAG TPA: ABC transporter permease [Candidatus Obscuribacterales bacterium]